MRILFFFFFVQYLHLSSINGGILSEKEALLAIKSAITNDTYNSLSSWKNTTDHCTWLFVNCSSSSHSPTVIYLDLSSLNLKGTLSPQIGFLTNLYYLSLLDNQFYGHVPSSLSLLSKLFYLDLGMNNFSGPLPLSLINMSELQYLWLDHNYFSGHIPSSHSLPSQLSYLSLSSNSFSGPLPVFVFNMSELQYLALDHNYFSGSIPSEFGKLRKLEYLFLCTNNLSGLIPSELWSIKSLNVLDFSKNQLHGEIPDSFSHHTNLGYNNQHGVIPEFIGGYNITNHQNSSICNLSKLKFLNLAMNKFHGEVPHCLRNTGTELIVLNLRSNNLKGIFPSSFFSNFHLLEYLDVSNNQLEGAVPVSLSNCLNLKVLNLGNNKFKDVFPYWVESLPNLEVLSLPFNNFYGRVISVDSAKSTTRPFLKLQILDISNNNFSGSLPITYIKHFAAMMDINVSATGSPQYLASHPLYGYYFYSIEMVVNGIELKYKKIITSMSTFDVSNNHFEGEIPSSIGMLRALRNLNLSHNLLTGNIPPSIGNLSSLGGLDLSSNRLVGEIPQELVDLTSLGVFNVSYNQLTGPIPHGKNFDTFLSDSYKGNLGLCGAPLLECKNRTIVPSLNNDNVVEKTELSMWKVVVIGFGSGTIVGFVWGYYILSKGSPFWLFKFLIKMEWALLDFLEHHFTRKSRARRTKN